MYMVLFRSPANRVQMKRVGQRMYPNRNDLFMDIYRGETEKPYGQIVIDNKPETPTGHQVASNVFGDRLHYDIGGGLKTNTFQDLELEEPPQDETMTEIPTNMANSTDNASNSATNASTPAAGEDSRFRIYATNHDQTSKVSQVRRQKRNQSWSVCKSWSWIRRTLSPTKDYDSQSVRFS